MPLDRDRLKVRVFERLWVRRGSDLCDLLRLPEGENGYPVPSLVEPEVVAENIPVVYEPAAPSPNQVTGGINYQGTHTLTMESIEATLAITPAYHIRIHARDATPERDAHAELLFEQPVVVRQPFNPVLVISATVTFQEFSRPVADQPWQRVVPS